MARRGKDERERDLSRLASEYLHGTPQWKIAEELGVSQPQICRDLKELRKRWLDSSLRDFDELKSQELAKIDELEREYWQGWYRSVGQKQRTVTERVNNPEGPDRNKAAVHSENMAGNPEFLRGVERCIERRCKLLGLDSPEKIAPTTPEGDKSYDPITDSERLERVVSIIDGARKRRDLEASIGAEAGGADPD